MKKFRSLFENIDLHLAEIR